jgi:MscS family membrane protein
MRGPSSKNLLGHLRLGSCLVSLVLLSCLAAWPQIAIPGSNPSTAQPEIPKDSLGRTTPRGTVIGFLAAARKGEYQVAAEYLNTKLHGKAAAVLAYKLSTVLDRRLPARLNQLSDQPEGSQFDPLNLNHDLVGNINTNNGSMKILLERVDRGKSGFVWLFSSKTLESIPEVYEEIDVVSMEDVLPGFLVTTRVLGIQLFEWVALLVGLPLLYLVTVLLNRLLSWLVGRVRRRLKNNPNLINPEVLNKPTRLLLIALTINWLRSRVGLPLLARQFWSSTSTVIAVTAIVWILILLASRGEKYVHERLRERDLSGTASVLRLMRRVIDLVLIFAGVLVILYYFGFSPTAGLAGLGIGGIAVALAAQKTLENVIGGVSLIVDQVVKVGDTLKVGEVVGQVDEVGLRSTRIRTLDRTVVSIPNGQMATMNLETLSVRDKFWFHPLISLRYGTSTEQIQQVLTGIRTFLTDHPSLERSSVRVRFLAFGSSSFDVDTFAYVYARDWNRFLAIQEELLFSIMGIVEWTGAQIALPSQVMYLTARNGAAVSELLQPSTQESVPSLEAAQALGSKSGRADLR